MNCSIVRHIKKIAGFFVLLFVVFCALPRAAHASEADTFAGSTYFETAAMQAEAAFPDSDFAVLVGTGWRDALAGSSLAGALGDDGCPILMTERDSLNPHTSSALEAMGVEHVVVLGGTLCVSESVVGELEGEGISVERIAGEDWRATQMAIYDYGLERGLWSDDTVIVASGDGFRDALSASPVAFSLKAPVFLVKDGGFDESQKSALSLAAAEGRFSRPVVLGGPLSVGDQARGFVDLVSRAASDGSSAVVSLAGDDWAATSAEVASWAVSEGCLSWDGAAFANGAGCHDALAGGPMQGACGSVLLLIEDERSDAVSLVASRSGEVSSIKFLGGHLVMPASVKLAICEMFDIAFGAIEGFKVYVDAGHGQNDGGNGLYDPGAVFGPYREATLTKQLSGMVGNVLRLEYGVEVYVNDDGGPYRERQKDAENRGCDVIVSLHFNSGGGTGSESLIHNKNPSPLSGVLQRKVHPYFVKATGLHDRGMKRQEVAILSGNIPATLLEICFIDNVSDMKRYNENKVFIAHEIARGVVS